MSRYRMNCVVLGLILILSVGCGGNSVAPGLQETGPGNGQTAIEEANGYPAFPEGSTAASPVRRVSDDDYVVDGKDFVHEYGPLNRNGDGSSHILISAHRQMAWAWYSVPDLTGDRPVSLTLDVQAAQLVPGDGTDLPLYYWVGVSDFTNRGWEFFGEYTAGETITLNSVELCERFVDAAGTLHFFILVPPTTVPGDHFAAQVNTGTVTTAPGYLQNKPHNVLIETMYTGDPPPGHSASALAAEQYVNLGWEHVAPFGAWDEDNAADTYEVHRRLNGTSNWELIGSVSAPTAEYCDPTDNDPEITEPLPCEWYHYSIQAVNEAGPTARYARSVFIPLAPPTELSATDGDFEEKIVLSWVKADAATGYQVFRDNDFGLPIAELGDVDSWEDTDIFPHIEYTYWVKSVSNGYLSEFSDSDTGYASVLFPPLDPPGDVSATDGDHADKVTLTWTKAENAVGYDIYRDDPVDGLYATLGDVDTWDDTGVEAGTVYTYWVRSLQVEYSSDLSDPDSGYAGTLPANPDLVCFPQDCYPDTDCLSIIHADPIIRRNPIIFYDPMGGGFIPEDDIGYNDILKPNGYCFTVEVAGGIWPKVAIVQTDDPASITSIGDGLPGVFTVQPDSHRITVDITAITTPGSPGDPDLPYSYKVFNSDGTSAGSGTFTYHPMGSAAAVPTGINWAVNVWDRVAMEIGDRSYTNFTLDASTIGIDAPQPDVLWFEFTDGWYFDFDTAVQGVYGAQPLDSTNLSIRFKEVSLHTTMYGGIAPAIAGLTPQGTVIAIHSPTILSFTRVAFPGWPGIFDTDGNYEIALDDPHFPGVEYVYPQTLFITGPNPNEI